MASPFTARAVSCMIGHPPPRLSFELFPMIDGYFMHLDRLAASLPASYYETITRAEVLRDALGARPLPLAPCHRDLLKPPAVAVHVDAIRAAE